MTPARKTVAATLAAAVVLAARKAYQAAVERDLRRAVGMPRHHPEKVSVRPHEAFLERLQGELWPDGSWMEVIEEQRRMEGWL